jgi:hypothetical protein
MTLHLDMPSRVSSLEQFEARHVKPKAGRTLIIGSHLYGDAKIDRRSLYADVVGIDLESGRGVDRVLNMECEMPADLGTFDHVECMSVLEHSPRPWLIAQNIERVMNEGATLFLTVPFVWDYHPYSSDYFRFTQEGVRSMFSRIEWDAMHNAGWRLTKEKKAGRLHIGEIRYPFHPRTEICAFGHKV